MPPPQFYPEWFGTEFIYTAIIVFFCFLIYFMTREFYNLSKYQGIKYFRYAFLFFGFAYLSRFIIHLFQLTGISSVIMGPRRFMFPSFMFPVGYFSTMAIFYLTYSTIWKRVDYKHFLLLSNIVAISLSLIAFLTRSTFILSMLQLALLLAAVIISVTKHEKRKKATPVRALYVLISLFWLINVFVLNTRILFLSQLKIIFQILSIFVFFVILYKVIKWIK